MVRPENAAVSRQVVEVVHDDSDEQVEHLSVRVIRAQGSLHATHQERREEDEGREVRVAHVGATGLRLTHVHNVTHSRARLACGTCHHDVLPCFPRRAAKY